MEMDDPWGSPWGEEETPKPHDSNTNKFAEIKPTTPVRASTLALAEKTNSPWDDDEDGDDGRFGAWAPISGDSEDKKAFEDKDDNWTGNRVASTQLTENGNPILLWGASTAISAIKNLQTLSPALLPAFADLPRQPSPDPWATEFQKEIPPGKTPAIEPKEELDVKSAVSLEDELAKDALPQAYQAPGRVLQGGLNGDHVAEAWDKVTADPTQAFNEDVLSGGSTTPHEGSPHGNGAREQRDLVIGKARKTPETVSIPEAEAVSPRPSSSTTEHSRHEENFQDSPRTSIDDEPRPSQARRKVSSKIQELVEHFDDLAKPAEDVTILSGTHTGRDLEMVSEAESTINDTHHDLEEEQGSQPEDEMDDFGDFEEGDLDIEDPSTDSFDPAENLAEVKAVAPKDLGPVTFQIDPLILDKIYSDGLIEPSKEREFVPDRDLDNTLSTIEQRKTWYRISRYGTKRQHDMGDDENYIRMNWIKSEVRKETLVIVARWMEEDRISGRVVLGGASKGSSVFGWGDRKAEPVPIAQAFATKRATRPVSEIIAPSTEVPREWPKGLVRSKSSSKGHSSSSASRRRNSSKSRSISESISTEGPTASFSWTSIPISDQPVSETDTKLPFVMPGKQELSPPKLRPNSKLTSSTQSTSDSARKSLAPVIIPPNMSSLIPPNAEALTPKSALSHIKSEDEDEWGEMVDSPVVATAPVLPTTSKSLTQKPSGFGYALPTTIDISMSSVSQSGMSPHASSFSAYDIIIPQTTASGSQQDGFEIFSSSSPNTFQEPYPTPTITPATSSTTTTATATDPWASADFSFFDAPSPTSTSNPIAAPIPTPDSKTQQPTTSTAKPPSEKVVKPKPKPKPRTYPQPSPSIATTPSTATSITSPTTPSVSTPASSLATGYKSKEQAEQDEIVARVVGGLPDLSYMLKK